MSTWLALTVAMVLLAANGFFVAAEFALISARRAAIEAKAVAGSKAASAALAALGRVTLMIAGVQLGITLCSLGLGALAEPAVASLIEPLLERVGLPHGAVHSVAFVLALAMVVFVHVVFGEMVPKNLTLAGPERAVLLLARPMTAIVGVFSPVLVLMNGIANGLLRMMRVTPRDDVAASFTIDGVSALVAQSYREGLLDAGQVGLLTGVLALDRCPVVQVMLPVDRLVTVGVSATLDEIEQVVAATGFSRLLVVDDLGALSGYVHLKDVIAASGDSVSASDLLRPLASLLADVGLHGALETMRGYGAHLAVVVDDDKVVGVVSFEDVLDSLVGQVRCSAVAG